MVELWKLGKVFEITVILSMDLRTKSMSLNCNKTIWEHQAKNGILSMLLNCTRGGPACNDW